MTYRLVIFDFDGTLADSFGWFVGTVNRMAASEGFRRIESHELESLRGLEARKVLAHIGVPLWKLPRLARLMRAEMAREIGGIQLFHGIDQVLGELARSGVELALVTSNSEFNARQVLGSHNAALFRHWQCGADLFGKRAKLRKVLQRSRTTPASAICIGDEIRDLQAARLEKIPFGAVSWGFTHPNSLEALAPDALFGSVQEIPEVVCPRVHLPDSVR